jgi:hypothetical protein
MVDLTHKGEIRITSKLVNIPLDSLHLRYLPKITPLELYPGSDPMRFSKSHHVSILHAIQKHGLDFARLKTHPYVQERRHRYNIGMTSWTDSHVKKHLAHRWETFRSLKKRGYDAKLAKIAPVIVLDRPLWETRFAWDSGFLKGPEIYDGAGRCAAAIMLGWKTIPGYMAEDAKPGSRNPMKYFKKIKGKYGR